MPRSAALSQSLFFQLSTTCKHLGRFRYSAAFAVCCLVAFHAAADDKRPSDTPFKIEDFAPKQGRFTLNAGLGYSVADSKDVNVSIIAVPFFHGALLLPDVTRSNRRKDTLHTNLGIRYAATDRLNFNLGARADTSRTSIQENSQSDTEHDSGLRNLGLGLDYRITTAFQHPYVVAFAETALIEKSDGKTLHGRSATLGLSSHWAFDPIIVSLTGTYSHLAKRKADGKSFDPGDVMGIGASVGLAVNPEISIRMGVTQSFRGGDKTDEAKGHWNSSTALTFGYTHRLSPALVMNLGVQAGIAGSETAQIFTNFTWRP